MSPQELLDYFNQQPHPAFGLPIAERRDLFVVKNS
jgi:hypothetical protein